MALAEDTRVGIFGGSFNPPHVAHVLAAAYALLVAPIDHVLVVPVYQHPFSKELASFEDRLAMCERAFFGLPQVTVATVERELGGESLTLRTLEHLHANHPRWRMRLLIGSDVVGDLPKWHRFDRVAQLAEPFVLARKGFDAKPAAGRDRGDERAAIGQATGGSMLPELSSTEVRRLFRERAFDALSMLVPSSVLAYARERALFADPTT